MINNVVITGRLTKDIELKYTRNNIATTGFTLAVKRNYEGSNGEKETDFINCVAFRKTAENIARFFSKGNLIGIQGRIQTRNYPGRDGNTVYVTEVIVENFTFLEAKQQNSDNKYNTFDIDMFSGLNDSVFMDKVGNNSIFDNVRNPFQD